jgi:hypothetical protein
MKAGIGQQAVAHHHKGKSHAKAQSSASFFFAFLASLRELFSQEKEKQ